MRPIRGPITTHNPLPKPDQNAGEDSVLKSFKVSAGVDVYVNKNTDSVGGGSCNTLVYSHIGHSYCRRLCRIGYRI